MANEAKMTRPSPARNPDTPGADLVPVLVPRRHVPFVQAAVALAAMAVPEQAERDDDLLSLVDAARIAATSARVVGDAVRSGELPAFGRQRDRAIRRSDLRRWIESRRVVHEPIADADLDRRMRRLAGGAR